MTIMIPVWVLWMIGGILGVIILGLAALGVLFRWVFKDGVKLN